MGIKELPNGTFEVSHSARHPITRVPKSLSRTKLDGRPIASKKEAEKAYKQIKRQIDESFFEAIVPTWEAMIDRYCEMALRKGNTQKTVENYQLGLQAYTLPDWARRPINTITTDEIRSLILEKLKQKSQNQQKNILKFIRAVFEYAVECGAINRNPSPKMKFRIGDKIKGVLTEAQVEIFLNKAKELDWDWYPHSAMAIYTGMRNGELYALTWDKVDLENRTIKVDCSWNNKDKFKSTKSGDDRMVEIAQSLLPILKEIKLRDPVSNFVLPRLEKWDKGEQARELRMFLLGLGLPRIRFHDLRATFATILMGRGVPPFKVMSMGGWKDMKTMMVYMRKSGIVIRGIMDGLDLHNPHTSIASVINIRQN